MNLGQEILFFLSGLGAFNGLILGVFFIFFAKQKGPAKIFLGVLLLAFSVRIGKSVLLFFDADTSRHILQIGLSACFLIGPALFLYVKNLLDPSGSKAGILKSPLGISFFVILALGIAFPYNSRPEAWNPNLVGLIYFQWFCFTLGATYLARNILAKLAGSDSPDTKGKWVLAVLVTNWVIMLAYFITFFTGSFISYISAALIFSAWTYWMFFYLFILRKDETIFSSQEGSNGRSKIEAEEARVMLTRLDLAIRKDALHSKSDLKLADLSKHVSISPHKLSQLLNQHDNGGFSQYINAYRIEEAKDMISRDEPLTLEAIGYEVGFNSKSTFYSAFKKETGRTPAQFKKDLLLPASRL